MRLSELNSSFTLLACKPPASESELEYLKSRFSAVPNEYLELALDGTEFELRFDNCYLRIWNPITCVEMNESYEISLRLPGSIPIADDGGGRVIFYFFGKRGWGLYRTDFGNLDPDAAVWIAGSLRELLTEKSGVENL